NTYPVGSSIRLSLGENTGHTAYISTTTAAAGDSAKTITVADESKFFVGESVRIYVLDEEAANPLAGNPYLISSISSALHTLTFTTIVGQNVPTGAVVVDQSSNAAAEIAPRA